MKEHPWGKWSFTLRLEVENTEEIANCDVRVLEGQECRRYLAKETQRSMKTHEVELSWSLYLDDDQK